MRDQNLGGTGRKLRRVAGGNRGPRQRSSHRDIKPANIVVGTHPKLIDFGLARRRDEHVRAGAPPAPEMFEADATPSGSDSTSLNAIEGTPLYMAPELWRGSPPSPASDIYSLGLVMWELLGGDLPHAGLHGISLVNAIASERLPSIEAFVIDTPWCSMGRRGLRPPGARDPPLCPHPRGELAVARLPRPYARSRWGA